MHRAKLNHKVLAVTLAGLCLIAVLVIALEYRYPFQLERKIAAKEIKANPVEAASLRYSVEDFSLAPLSSYAEITERPLFRTSRRPPDPVKIATQSQQAAKQAKQEQTHIEELFALSGVVIVGNKAVALLRDKKNNRRLRVSQGEKVRGWRVDLVLPDRVLFSHNGRGESLELIRNFEKASAGAQRRKRRRAALKRQ